VQFFSVSLLQQNLTEVHRALIENLSRLFASPELFHAASAPIPSKTTGSSEEKGAAANKINESQLARLLTLKAGSMYHRKCCHHHKR
jgi:hypothetical protein